MFSLTAIAIINQLTDRVRVTNATPDDDNLAREFD